MSKARRVSRLEVAGRTLAAAAGGYAATYALTGALGVLLPLSPSEAVYLSAMLAFAFHTSFVLWAFPASSQRMAWGVPLAVVVLARVPWLWLGGLR